MGIADFELDAAPNGSHEGRRSEVEGVADGEVEGDDGVVVEGSTGGLEGGSRGGTEGKDVVGGCEGGEAVVEGWVGDGKGAATDEGEGFGRSER